MQERNANGWALTTVPFAGFYESLHSHNVDEAINQVFQDDSGDVWPYEQFHDAWEHVDHREVERRYADFYTQNFSGLIECGLAFDKMESPREYNFTTDRIFAYIDRQHLALLFLDLDLDTLAERVREKFTSRAGFASWYSPDLAEWPESLGDWDHNQIGTALEVYAEQMRGDDWDQWAEHELMEDDLGNGYVEGWIFDAADDEFRRLADLARYLRERESRKYRRKAA